METRMRGKASVGEMEMYIKRWDRTLRMKFWEVYPDKSLVRITAPAEDAGKGSLKLGKDLWSYDPNIDQIQKIPPSLMLDSWMGSDLTNDDISRSSSIKLDYNVSKPENQES
jgi:outer membrane lipoprotein-sorting protein